MFQSDFKCCEDPGSSTGVNEFNYVDGKKGKLLVRGRYRYFLHHRSTDGCQMWKCLQRNCPARFKISGKKILREDPHSCELADPVLEEFKAECINRATHEVTAIPKIYQDVYKNFVDKGLNFVGNTRSFKSIRSLMYRARHSKLAISKTTFKTPSEVQIPNVYMDFLLFKNDDMCAFSSTEGRKLLISSETCFMDGTFWSCPMPFYQLYSIHVDMGSSLSQTLTCPVVFILLPNKQQHTYELMLDLIKFHIPEWKPKKIIVDFEIAIINALNIKFPNVIQKGCNFHFKQALSKKKRQLMIRDKESSKHVAKCGALAYLPVQYVEDGWLEIMAEAPENKIICQFNDYFVSTWLDSPSFPITLWNCQGERHRTTNVVEAWHKRLNNIIPKKPRFIMFLETIRNEAKYYEKYRCTPILNRRRQSINKDIRLQLIINNLQNDQITLRQAIKLITDLSHV